MIVAERPQFGQVAGSTVAGSAGVPPSREDRKARGTCAALNFDRVARTARHSGRDVRVPSEPAANFLDTLNVRDLHFACTRITSREFEIVERKLS
jgi:hypothetical protein